jgi:hypothetical protein
VADLKAHWKKKGKEELHTFCENTKRDRGQNYFERYYRNGSSPWFSELKMNRRAFVSVNSMRADHTSLKASLNRFNIVSMAECECGDGLQTEDHIFWDCKPYEEQRATMMAILSENRKMKYPKSVTELLRLEEKKICAISLILHKQNSNIYLKSSITYVKEKEANVQNINGKFSDLRYIYVSL